VSLKSTDFEKHQTNATPDIQEIFGSHYELPELGPVGSNGMALPRDFEIPVASFDIDSSPWEGNKNSDITMATS